MLLIGTWLFTAILYREQLLPKPNPHLQIQWHFEDERLNTLTYWRDNERGTCQRRALYRTSQNSLWQQVVWVNPANHSSCASDTDMQIGNISESEIITATEFFLIRLSAGEEPLYFKFERWKLSPVKLCTGMCTIQQSTSKTMSDLSDRSQFDHFDE